MDISDEFEGIDLGDQRLKERGYLDHTTLAVTPERLALGVVDVQMIARSEEGFGKSKERQSDPIETKEIARWLNSYRTAAELQALVPNTHLISVSDREGDLYEIFIEARDALQKVDFIIRSGKDRRLPERDLEAGDDTWIKLHDRPLATSTLWNSSPTRSGCSPKPQRGGTR